MATTSAPPDSTEITELLRALHAGDTGARRRLFDVLYDEFRHLASHHMKRERDDHTLAPTALVHETFLRLFPAELRCQDRCQLFALASQVMRRVLIDSARRRLARKRSGRRVELDLSLMESSAPARDHYLIALDRALEKLASREPELVEVVELRFFGGYSVEETAEALSISTPTVKRRWRLARAWLHRDISRELEEGR